MEKTENESLGHSSQFAVPSIPTTFNTEESGFCSLYPYQKPLLAYPNSLQVYSKNWLRDNFELWDEECSIPRELMYEYYEKAMQQFGQNPESPANFGKLVHYLFKPSTRRLGPRGNSKYHYCGMRVKSNSYLTHVAGIQWKSSRMKSHRHQRNKLSGFKISKKKIPADTSKKGSTSISSKSKNASSLMTSSTKGSLYDSDSDRQYLLDEQATVILENECSPSLHNHSKGMELESPLFLYHHAKSYPERVLEDNTIITPFEKSVSPVANVVFQLRENIEIVVDGSSVDKRQFVKDSRQQRKDDYDFHIRGIAGKLCNAYYTTCTTMEELYPYSEWDGSAQSSQSDVNSSGHIPHHYFSNRDSEIQFGKEDSFGLQKTSGQETSSSNSSPLYDDGSVPNIQRTICKSISDNNYATNNDVNQYQDSLTLFTQREIDLLQGCTQFSSIHTNSSSLQHIDSVENSHEHPVTPTT